MNKNLEVTSNELYDLYPSGRNPKVLKSAKGYDRVRDRKNQRLYDYDDEETINEIDKDTEGVF
jgi:hypothetical protein